MKTSPTKGDWLGRIRSLWASGHFTGGPVNKTQPGILTVTNSADIPGIHKPRNIPQILEENAALLKENGDLRTQLLASKHNERQLAWRIEEFRKRWPAIHKQFFTKERKAS